MSKKGNWALGTLLVAGVSYVAGVLTAPKSGKETRKDIKQAARKAKLEAERKLKQAHSELTLVIDEASMRVKESKSKADAGLQKAIDAAESVRQKTREILSAAHEGESEDKDLQKAIDEVKKASAHLKSYLESKEPKKG